MSQIKVKDLDNPITMKLSSNGSGSCSFFNEENLTWEKLECPILNVQDMNSGDMQCCSTHMTLFAVVEDSYFSRIEAEKT